MSKNRARDNARKRFYNRRDKTLLNELSLIASLACESHTIEERNRRLERILQIVLELNRSNKMNDEKRKRLVENIIQSSDATDKDVFFDEETKAIKIDIDINIFPEQLARKMLW